MPTRTKRKKHAPRANDRKERKFTFRLTAAEFAKLERNAANSLLSTGAFARKQIFATPGPRSKTRPALAAQQFAQLLGHVGKIGGHTNQLAHWANVTGVPPAIAELKSIHRDILKLRESLLKVLQRKPGNGH